MNRILLALILILGIISAQHLTASNHHLWFDAASFDLVFSESIRIEAGYSYQWEGVELSLLTRYGQSANAELFYLENSLSVAVKPFEDLGLFAGLSAFKAGFFWGIGAMGLSPMLSSETFIGWDIPISRFHIMPKLIISETLLEESEEERILQEHITQFSKVRFSLLLGFRI